MKSSTAIVAAIVIRSLTYEKSDGACEHQRLDLFESSGFGFQVSRRDNMLADKDFHPETRNLTPETKYNSRNSKNLTKVRGRTETCNLNQLSKP
jgi:hypothetical protein